MKTDIYSTKSGYAIAKFSSSTEDVTEFNWKLTYGRSTHLLSSNTYLESQCWIPPCRISSQRRGISTDGVFKICGEPQTELRGQIPFLFKPSPLSMTSVSQLLQACRKG